MVLLSITRFESMLNKLVSTRLFNYWYIAILQVWHSHRRTIVFACKFLIFANNSGKRCAISEAPNALLVNLSKISEQHF